MSQDFGSANEADVRESRVRLRDSLSGVPVYRPGRPPTRVEGVTSYKMSSNENPYPPLPGVQQAVADAAATLNRYPDMGSVALREAIAAEIGVGSEEIVTGTGSSGVLSAIINAACEAGDEVVYAWRSFEAYPIMVALSGARSVQVPVTEDGRHDLEAMADAVTRDTRVLIVCSPNNPTGTVAGADEVERLLARVPDDLLVVLDEAYLEFVRDDAALRGLDVYRRHPNVVVLRTFSKAYGLAGLRVGYAVAREAVAARLRSCVIPFAVTEMAVAAVRASLAAKDELAERVEALVHERTRVQRGLLDLGYQVPQSEANFVWLPLGRHTAAFAEAADAAGLAVRPFDGEGVRVSVEAEEANTRLLEVAAQFGSHQA